MNACNSVCIAFSMVVLVVSVSAVFSSSMGVQSARAAIQSKKPATTSVQQQTTMPRVMNTRLMSTNQTLNVMPLPSEVQFLDGKFRLTTSSMITLRGAGERRLTGAARRFLYNVGKRTGLHFGQLYLLSGDSSLQERIIVECKREGKLVLGEDETYHLRITPERIMLRAETDIGALRGLATLQQLVSSDSAGYCLPALVITDKPRFPWRGLLLDVSRHFFSVDIIKKQLDLLALVKMNVLHLHLSDDHGFRIECRSYPKLHDMGSDGQFYTQEEMRGVIRYADERGIRIVPEFDLPGHSTSWYVGYPEFSSGTGATFGGPYTIERRLGRSTPVMNPIKEEVYQFLDVFFAEMSALFPDEYMHIGGDENNGKQWAANPEIQAFMQANAFPTKEFLQNYFNKRLLGILTKNQKKMMGWDEIFVDSVPKTIMIQSWRGREAMFKAARAGYTTILSHGFYLDINQSTEQHYLVEPVPDSVRLGAKEALNVMGGESCMWSEWVTPENLDSRLWPRNAVIAERLWSPKNVRNVDDMYRRLDYISAWLEEGGSQHESNVFHMLRRLVQHAGLPFAQYEDILPLKTFVDVLETVKEYRRAQLIGVPNYSTMLPLTGIPDLVRPDARVARQFRQKTKQYLENKQGVLQDKDSSNIKEDLLVSLRLWKENHVPVMRIIERSPRLKDLEEHSLLLSMLAQTGMDAIAMLENNIKATAEWREVAMLIIQRAKQPRAQTDIMIIPAIEDLVKAVSAR